MKTLAALAAALALIAFVAWVIRRDPVNVKTSAQEVDDELRRRSGGPMDGGE